MSAKKSKLAFRLCSFVGAMFPQMPVCCSSSCIALAAAIVLLLPPPPLLLLVPLSRAPARSIRIAQPCAGQGRAWKLCFLCSLHGVQVKFQDTI